MLTDRIREERARPRGDAVRFAADDALDVDVDDIDDDTTMA